MGYAIFRDFQLWNPWTDFQKILHSWLRQRPHPTCKNLDQLAQRGCVCACVNLSSWRVYIFRFLGFFSFIRIATGPPVGPIIVVNGLNDAFWWHSHSLYGLVKKNWNWPPLAPKFKNLHYGLWQLWRAITQAPLKIRARCLHQMGVFGVGQSNGIIQISVRPPLLPWQQADVIWTQNRPLLSMYRKYHQDSCTE